AFTLSGGSLTVANTFQDTGTFTLAGGSLIGADVVGATTITATNGNGTLDGVTLNANMNLSGGARATVANGMVLNATITISNSACLTFNGTQSLSTSRTWRAVFGDGKSSNTINQS